MRKRILIAIAACFYYSGLVKLAYWWTAHSRETLIILNYHQASGGQLLKHLRYLQHRYRLLPLEVALTELAQAPESRRTKPDQRPLLVLTFDDGYHDNYTHGFPLAKMLQVPFTIFLIPGYIESGDYFWWGEARRLLKRTRVHRVTLEGKTFCLTQARDRKKLRRMLDTRLRYASSVTEREAFLAMARTALAVSADVLPEEQATLPLQWSEVQEMEESGWVTFGAHSMHHPILACLRDPEEVHYEIRESRRVIEQYVGHPVKTFAYPIGQMQHIGDKIQAVVQDAGYDWALTTSYGFNDRQRNPYLLRRIEVDVGQHWLVVAAEASGLWGFFSRLRWVSFIRKYCTDAS